MIEEFARLGVRAACISPGSRSSALVTALLRIDAVRPWVCLDERSAAFFALGIARETRRPVLLVCTSGTAAANFLPAVVEASLSQVAMIVLTADRPPELRDCHAPQTIDQPGIYGSHVRWAVDVPAPEAGVDLEAYYRTVACRAFEATSVMRAGPVHVNFPMREPLIDVAQERSELERRTQRGGETPWTKIHPSVSVPGPDAVRSIATRIAGARSGIIVCGPGSADNPAARGSIASLAARIRWPIVADPLSGLRFGPHDRAQVVDAYDLMLRDPEFRREHRPAAVIQFGRPPVSKPLTQFLCGEERLQFHLMVAAAGEWPDPSHRATDVIRTSPDALCRALAESAELEPSPARWTAAWTNAAAAVRRAMAQALAGEPELYEGKIFPQLLAQMPEGGALHVGNSMPVRDLDTYGASCATALEVFCNRGANGIDGVMSAAIGAAAVRNGPTVLVIGDLSFLHDLGALQLTARHRVHLVIVLINNDGGGIFSFLPQADLGDAFERYFATPHGLDFEPAVKMVDGRYARPQTWAEFEAALAGALGERRLHVIEVRSERRRNLELHRRHAAAAVEALHEWRASGRGR